MARARSATHQSCRNGAIVKRGEVIANSARNTRATILACYHQAMDRRRAKGEAERRFMLTVPVAVRDTRRAIGWTQAHLGDRVGVSQASVSRFESGDIDRLTLGEVGRLLDVLAVRADLALTKPHIVSSPLQRDAAHARCVAYAAGRLRAMGWDVRLEVEIQGVQSHGWIDVLACHGDSRAAFVGEVKTELADIGAVQRQLGWYTRSAREAGRSLGWQIDALASGLLVLATDANEARLTENRDLIREAFPIRASQLVDWLAVPTDHPAAPAVALIDPRSRRQRWLIPTSLDGRRSALRYANYREFMQRGPERRPR
jgi:transcriptional regulator with XRE-family HTH domain